MYKNMLKLKDNTKKIKGKIRITTFQAGTKEIIRQTGWMPNLIVLGENTGMNLLIKRLINNTTYDLIITSAEIGTDDTPPANGNTNLIAPVVTGIEVSNVTQVDVDEALIEFFIPDAQLPEGTYKEFGLRCGTQLFSRVLISPVYEKTIGSDTKVEYTINVNNI